MKKISVFLVAVLSLLIVNTVIAAQITTSFSSNNAARGSMFNLTTYDNAIEINRFDINLGSGVIVPVSVYYKLGTFAGYQGDANAWTLLGTETVTSAGADTPTPLAIGGLPIPANTLMGLFVTTDGSITGAMQYYDGDTPVLNSDLTLNFGYGTYVPFDGRFASPRTWSGTIYYDVTSSVPEPSTFLLVGVGLASLGLLKRRK
jgi:hypothetical protein